MKEEQFLRYFLTTAALAFLLAGTSAFASAAPATPAATAASVQSDTAAQSPDVATWSGASLDEGSAQSEAATVPHMSMPARLAHPVSRFASRIFSRTSTIAKSLTSSALRFLGTPYVFGGTSNSGFDCSGYVQHVFAMMGVSIPRTADAQFYSAHRAVGGPKAGDLVFFQTYEPGPSHVGIYIGNGRFVHASSSHGVMVSTLSDSYWSARYIGAKRVLASR